MQFSYIDGEEHVFMNMETYEEERIKTADIDKRDFIKDEMTLQVLKWRGQAIDVQVHASATEDAARPRVSCRAQSHLATRPSCADRTPCTCRCRRRS